VTGLCSERPRLLGSDRGVEAWRGVGDCKLGRSPCINPDAAAPQQWSERLQLRQVDRDCEVATSWPGMLHVKGRHPHMQRMYYSYDVQCTGLPS
jgi:hypothetical protein